MCRSRGWWCWYEVCITGDLGAGTPADLCVCVGVLEGAVSRQTCMCVTQYHNTLPEKWVCRFMCTQEAGGDIDLILLL